MASTTEETGLPDSYLAKHPFDRTRLGMVPRSQAADAAHLALFQLQDLPRTETMMLGIGVLFAAFCSRTGTDPQELHAMGLAVLKERTDGDVPTSNSLQVLRDFAAIRVMGEQTTFY
jgi:hypothetical protein